jgi:tRNA A-37 threonylcarbamoyl transferase component Bud32
MPTEIPVDFDRGPEAKLRQVCAELERQLRTGESTCAEHFLAADPELFGDADAALELIYAEFVIRAELNQKPDPAAWYARFPQWQARLQRLFEVHDLVATPPLSVDSKDTAQWAIGPTGRPDSYELLEKIGQGGMGVVYKARQVGLNRIVALKLIKAGPHADAAELARFRAEGEAAARLQHANIVQIHEVGERDGQPYLSLEFVEGGSLAAKLAGRPLPPREAAHLVETLARAVHYAHQRGIVHRDLKPANILLQKSEVGNGNSDLSLLTSDFCPKIADFGLAARLENATAQTRPGTLAGTPSYMAPEQAEGRSSAINVTTDVYGLGTILYEALTGRPPFRGASELDTLEQVRSAEPAPPARLQPALPRDLETICLKCLSKESRRRYATAEDLADDLRRFLTCEPIRARATGRLERAVKWARRRPAVASLLVALLAVVVVAFVAVTLLWRGAADALDDVEQARARLLEQQRQTEAALYDKQLLLARREWEALHFDQAKKLLGECDPERRDREWRYLHHVLHARVLTYQATGVIRDVAYDASGRRLALAISRSLTVLDAGSGKEVFSRPGFVLDVAFQDTGNHLVANGLWRAHGTKVTPREITVWNLTTGVNEGGFAVDDGWRDNTYLSPHGNAILMRTGRDGKTVLQMHDPATGKVLHDLGQSGTMVLAAVSGDGSRFAALDSTEAVQGGPPKIYVWDLAARKRQCIIELGVKLDGFAALAVSGAGNRVAIAYQQRGSPSVSKIKIFDAAGGAELLTFVAHAETVNGLAFCPDGRRLASAAQDRSVILWEVATARELLTFREDSKALVPKTFSPDGRRLAGTDGVKLYVWNTHPPKW